MGCRIRVNRHGYLAYRLRWNGRESHEGTGLRDTPKNRATLEARACVITDEMPRGHVRLSSLVPGGEQDPPVPPLTPSATAQAHHRRRVRGRDMATPQGAAPRPSVPGTDLPEAPADAHPPGVQ